MTFCLVHTNIVCPFKTHICEDTGCQPGGLCRCDGNCKDWAKLRASVDDDTFILTTFVSNYENNFILIINLDFFSIYRHLA